MGTFSDDVASATGKSDAPAESADLPQAAKAERRDPKPWSPEDRRMLLITVGGGLAANLAAVIFVAVGILVARYWLHANAPSPVSASQLRGLPPKDRAAIEAALRDIRATVTEQRWSVAIITVAALITLIVLASWRRRRGRGPIQLIAFAGIALVLLICGLAWLGLAAGIK